MKLYINWDMEGVSGLYQRDQAWFWDRAKPGAHEEGRRLLTADMNAATAAALAAGVDQLVVAETHSSGGNALCEQLLADPRVTYEGEVGHSGLMPSLDETFDGLLLLGQHARAGTPGAFLDHTMSSTTWFDFSVNGQSVGEVGIEACYAGHWGVPLIMVQGDEACCAEAQAQFPGIVTAPVKHGLMRFKASGPAPELGRELTARNVAEAVALARAKTLQPFRPELPLTVRLTFTSTDQAEAAADKPGVRRVDGRTVECRVERQCDVLTWLA